MSLSQSSVVVAQMATSSGHARPEDTSSRSQRSASTTSARGAAHETTSGAAGFALASASTSPGNQVTSAVPGSRQASRTLRARACNSGRHTGATRTTRSSSTSPRTEGAKATRCKARSRRSRGVRTPGGRWVRTSLSILARSSSRAPPLARSARAKSASQTRVSVQATERVMPGSSRMLSRSLKPPASSAVRMAGSRSCDRAGRTNPPARRAASCGTVMICMPASARRAATIRLMRKASGPSTTIVRRFMDSAQSPQGRVTWDRILPAPTFLPVRSQASEPALRCPRPGPQAGRGPCGTLAPSPV